MRNTVHCIACFFLTMVVMGTVPCHAAVYGDALYSSVLSAIPGITFVTSTPSMSNDTSVYFSSFGWPADRVAQQADYVSVPVAVMSLCLAVQTTGAVNATTAPTMTDIGDLLLGKSTGAWWLRSDWTSTRRVTKVYLASSSLPPVLNALIGWYGAPFTANTDLSSLGSTVSILPTDADVTNALANDPSAIAFVPFIATAQSKMVCLSITSVPGSSYMIPPTAVWTYSMKINVTTLNVTCVPGYGCYPFVGALVAHVRKRSSVAACDSSTSLLPVIYNFTSPSSPIFVPLGRWSIQLPTTATILAVLQTLISSVCMPETRVLVGVGSDAVNSVLRDWGYQYFMESNGTAFVTYNTVSTPEAALEAVDARVADFAAGPALNASDRAAFPALHSFPSSAFTVSIIANAAQSGQLVLPRCSITSIFNGTIRWWNDTAIQAVNSVALMPQKLIDVTVRVDPSRTTDIFMAGLRALDMECFGTTSIPPTATLPSFVRATQFTGNDAVAIYVATTPYTISWLPTSYFSSYYFVEVSIQADDGSLTNSADVQKMLQSGTLDPETTDLTLSNVTKHPFPFVALSSLIVPLDTEGSCDRTKSNVEFIVWALSSATALNYIYYDFFFALPTSVLSSCVQYFTHTVRCDGALLYPPPPTPLLWWPIALVGGLILVAAVVGIRWRYWQLVYGVRPTDPSSAIAVMFVGVKNQAAVQEAGEENVMAVCRLVADTTRRMARKHRCYEARRVDAWTTMIVAKSAQAAVACAEDVVLTLSVGVQWLDDVLRHPMPIQPVLDLHDRKSSASIPLSKRSGRSSRVRGADGSSRRGGVASSQTHRTGSTPTQLTIQNCVPQIYAGVHWTHVMMDDSQGDSVSYYGAGIGAAGGVADLAVDGQVLVSREVACEIDSKHPEQVDYSFTPLTTASGDVTALALTTPRFPTWLLERTALRRKSLEEKGADSGGGTTILAALASADGALAKRRIAVVSLLMRDMVNEGVDGRGDVVRDALETLRDIVTAHRGEILSIMDGVVTVTIGASGPVAMAAVRATQIAMDASDLCIAAGIHSGPALVGNAMGGKPATNGRVVTGASLMRLVAARANVPIVASDAVHGDLSARFQLSTVDLVAAPWDLKKQVRCYAVVEERSDTGDNEWLYVLQDGFAPLERRLDDCLRGKALAADEPANPSEPSLASRFFDRHQEYFALSNDLYNGVQAARDAEGTAGFLVNRLVAVGTFAMVGGTRATPTL